MSTKPKRNRFEGRAATASVAGLKAVVAAPQAITPSELPLYLIRPNSRQPRQHFDDQALRELSDSIKARGILQPIRVRRDGDHFEIISGERRYRAAQMAGLTTIPATVETRDEYTELDQAIDALVENLQRDDLNVVEEVEGIFQLIQMRAMAELGADIAEPLDYMAVEQALNRMRNAETESFGGLEQIIEEVVSELGFSWKTLAIKKSSVWRWPPEVVQALRERAISLEVARVLQRVEDPAARERLLRQVVAEQLSATALRSLLKAEVSDAKVGIGVRAPVIRKRLASLLRQVEGLGAGPADQHLSTQLDRLESITEELERLLAPKP